MQKKPKQMNHHTNNINVRTENMHNDNLLNQKGMRKGIFIYPYIKVGQSETREIHLVNRGDEQFYDSYLVFPLA